MSDARREQGGFTLVELVVVIAILGVMAAIAVPMVNNFLSSSKEQAYISDTATIQASVDAYFSSPSNLRFLGRRQYPIFGADRTEGTLIPADHDHDADHPDNHDHHEQDHGSTGGSHHHTTISEDLTELGNPWGGTKGGSPKWIDDGDGIRTDIEEELLDNNDDDASLDNPGWHVAIVTREGTDYIVDSRDYFIDFSKLAAAGLLEKVPTSASLDTGGGSESGSYSWYIDTMGRVRSLLFFFPEIDQTGYQDVFP